MAILRCTEAFAVMEGNVPRVVRTDDIVDSDDPVIKGHEGSFEPVEDHLNRQRRIREGETPTETATADPGQKRTRTAPRKRAAKKAAPAKAKDKG